jgi:methylglyoxal synthase
MIPSAFPGTLPVGAIHGQVAHLSEPLRRTEVQPMDAIKHIALVAHDNRKQDLIEWVEWNCVPLVRHKLVCTGTTGRMIEAALRKKLGDTPGGYSILKLKSGPLGGDQQLGAMIVEGRIDCIIFLWDPMTPHPHDVDVKALLRIAVLYNIPIACNRSTADFIISSPLMTGSKYRPALQDHSGYLDRRIETK